MVVAVCSNCGFSPIPDGARFCQQCGAPVQEMSKTIIVPDKTVPTFLWPLGSILFTLVLSWFFIAVLHWPIFILGAFLPLAWKFSKKP